MEYNSTIQTYFDLTYENKETLVRDYLDFLHDETDLSLPDFPSTSFIKTIVHNYIKYVTETQKTPYSIVNELIKYRNEFGGTFNVRINNVDILCETHPAENYAKLSVSADDLVTLGLASENLKDGITYNEKSTKEKRFAYKSLLIKNEIRLLVDLILYHYCSSNRGNREIIFRYDTYKTIKNAVLNCKTIRFKLIREKPQDDFRTIQPYCIKIDTNSQACYVAGISEDNSSDQISANASTEESNGISISKSVFSCKIINMTDIKEERKLKYSKEVAAKVTQQITNNGIAFISRKSDMYTIYLTESGYKKYKYSIFHMRPIPAESVKRLPVPKQIHNKEYLYIAHFYCSDFQIFNYFFSFGDEVYIDNKATQEKFKKVAYAIYMSYPDN